VEIQRASHRHAEAWLAVATQAAHAAARVIRVRAADIHTIDWRVKRQADFVSDVDLEAEAAITEVVRHGVPDARVLGEELTPDASLDAGVVFVADPLDGTTNFLHGYPSYSVSIGVVADGELEAGVIVDVTRNATFTALRGRGAYRDGERIQVSTIDDPGRSLIGTGFPFKHLEYLDAYQRQWVEVLKQTSGIRRAGSAALDLADVACGRFEAFWELGLAPWDVAAGMLLIREAGGIVTDALGAPRRVGHGPLVAGNPTMHRWLLEIIRSS
jgi:myo-inositol-1(or 4)-monophosphatase